MVVETSSSMRETAPSLGCSDERGRPGRDLRVHVGEAVRPGRRRRSRRRGPPVAARTVAAMAHAWGVPRVWRRGHGRRGTRPWSGSQVGRGVAREERDGAGLFQVTGARGDGPRRR